MHIARLPPITASHVSLQTPACTHTMYLRPST
ncbi:hypothetical protein E2C01_077432 [Portunus trituberculatus]|uniref:Uncharacterized protein n=1 Tax=Portunus trituberculatus TaxID=210409 RepID=A0A5B7IEF4_PORTR|nr:hypothetical protein [Portunus trituberculatus]